MRKIDDFYYKNNRLQQVRGFLNVVKYGNMTEAAKKMNLTQSAISCQISSLEKDLGVKLFDRVGIKLNITKDGKRFYDMSVPHVQAIDNLFENFITTKNEDEENHIRIAGHQFMMIEYVPKWIAEIKKLSENPEKLRFSLYNITKEEAIEKLINEELDVIFFNLEEDSYPELNSTKIIDEPFVLVFNKSRTKLLEKKHNEITFEDIFSENLILLNNSYYGKNTPKLISNITQSSRINVFNLSYESIRNLVFFDTCISYTPLTYALTSDSRYTEVIKMKSISHLIKNYVCSFVIKRNIIQKESILKLIKILTNSYKN